GLVKVVMKRFSESISKYSQRVAKYTTSLLVNMYDSVITFVNDLAAIHFVTAELMRRRRWH
ncbi:hypothetical protein NL387_27340, partial [Klebsiella pneumoniae]|nr:hypothetical protein [Klebsiella pneumoniae]